MRKVIIGLCAIISLAASTADEITVGNGSLQREISVVDGVLTTTRLENKISKSTLTPSGAEFRLRISEGTDKTGTDVLLTATDFKVNKLERAPSGAVVQLENIKYGLNVTVLYTLNGDESVMRKQLEITAGRPITIERIDVDSLTLTDVYQPYQEKAITTRAKANWKPGLGQPLYTSKSALFLGVEFPASYNYVEKGSYYCGYQYGHELQPGQTLKTYVAVLGAGDDPAFISDAFQDYINAIRIRPLRLQTQYNSWFDFNKRVTRESFAESVETVNNELCVKRGVKPLKAYVIDHGWHDTEAKTDWSSQVYTVNKKFDSDFKRTFQLTQDAQSHLGLWVSPGCVFGGQLTIPKMR